MRILPLEQALVGARHVGVLPALREMSKGEGRGRRWKERGDGGGGVGVKERGRGRGEEGSGGDGRGGEGKREEERAGEGRRGEERGREGRRGEEMEKWGGEGREIKYRLSVHQLSGENRSQSASDLGSSKLDDTSPAYGNITQALVLRGCTACLQDSHINLLAHMGTLTIHLFALTAKHTGARCNQIEGHLPAG